MTLMATETVPQTTPVTRALNELRVCRGFMDGLTTVLEVAGEEEVAEKLRLSLDCLSDCIDDLEVDEPTVVQQIEAEAHKAWRDSIADDRRDDLSMDGDHADPDRGEV